MERFKYRKDENHRVIEKAFVDLGFSVINTAKVGGGAPDLFAAKFGKTIAVEIKTTAGALNEKEIKFMESWKGRYIVVRTVGEIVTLEDDLREELENG